MKKLLLFALLTSATVAVSQPQIINNSWTLLTSDLCYNDPRDVLEDMAVYEPGIQGMSSNYVNVGGDFFGTITHYSANGDTAFVTIEYMGGGQTPTGPYSMVITFDSDNGTSNTVTIPVTIHAAPNTPTIDANAIGYFCPTDAPFDINANTSPAGGVFSFDNGNGPNDLISPDGILDPAGMPAGYSETNIQYTYTDANGCSAGTYYDWYNYVLEPPTFTATTNDASSCGAADGNIAVTPDGSTANYDISLQNGDSVSTGNLQPGSLGNLAPGLYVVTVADDSGCYATNNYFIEAGDLSITGDVVNGVSCPGLSDGNIDITVNTNNNYTLYWEHGTFVEDLNNLTAGDYTVNVTDENGCEVSKSFTVESPTLKFDEYSMYVYDYDCMQTIPGEINAAALYSNGPASYSFSGGGTLVNDSTVTDLTPGNYDITVTDAGGCTIDTTVMVNSYTDFYAYTNDVVDADCGTNNGSIDMQVDIYNQSSLDYYSWNTGATSEDLTNISPGTYTFTMYHISNPDCNFTREVIVGTSAPLKNPICMVTVDSLTTTNLVVWEREETSGVSHYNIYRETSNLNQFTKIDSVLTSEETMFNDVWASPLVKSWGYKISAVNNCGIESPKSSVHRTIHLRREIQGPDVVLNWNKYFGFTYTQHDLWRFTASTGWQMIGSVPYGQTSYLDTPPNTNGLDYAIEVDPGYVCQSTKATSHNASRSNRSQGVYNPGEGTGASNNTVTEFDNISFTMYPNPTKDMTTLFFEKADQYNITIYDINGSVVNAFQLNGQRTDLNTSELTNGIYIVDVQNDNYKFTQKLVVSH